MISMTLLFLFLFVSLPEQYCESTQSHKGLGWQSVEDAVPLAAVPSD